MRKHKFFFTFLKKINLLIDKLLTKYLNKLKLIISFNKPKSNKLFPISLIFFIIIFSYLLLPTFYNKTEIQKKFQDQLKDRLNIKFNLSNNIQYNFFPRPHFIFSNSVILEDQYEIVKIQKLKVYVSLFNFFSKSNLKIKDIKLESANFNLNYQNHNFFLNLLNQNFNEGSLTVKDSNIFFRNKNNEVLFINKILNLKYFYEKKKLTNLIISKNEIFNLPYSIKIYNDQIKKKLFSELDLKFLNLHFVDVLDYNSEFKKGLTKFNFNQTKIISKYELTENEIIFHLFDNLKDLNFNYKGKVNLAPFFSNFSGNSKKIDPLIFLNSDSFVLQILKTEILNNKNLNFILKVSTDKIKNLQNFNEFSLQSKIHDGFIDIDNSSISWKNNVDFTIFDSLIYVKDGELILSGQLDLTIKDYKKVYQFLLTPKNYRSKINNIKINFVYNFDQKIMNLYNVKVDEYVNKKIDEALNTLLFRNNVLQNKIYLKNILNKAIKVYAG